MSLSMFQFGRSDRVWARGYGDCTDRGEFLKRKSTTQIGKDDTDISCWDYITNQNIRDPHVSHVSSVNISKILEILPLGLSGRVASCCNVSKCDLACALVTSNTLRWHTLGKNDPDVRVLAYVDHGSKADSPQQILMARSTKPHRI